MLGKYAHTLSAVDITSLCGYKNGALLLKKLCVKTIVNAFLRRRVHENALRL